jgi:hypothetical protein
VTQHLTEGIIPFGNEGGRKLRDLIRGWSVITPHCWLQSLVSSIVWNELTKFDESAAFCLIIQGSDVLCLDLA